MAMILLQHVAVYFFIGIFSGLMAGLFGIGGGIVVVPGLTFIFQQTGVIPPEIAMHVATGCSLAIMIFTSHVSLQAHLKVGEVLWSEFYKLWAGIALGAMSGVVLAGMIPTFWLKGIFAVFLITIAVKMFRDIHVSYQEWIPGVWINRIITFFIGLKSGLLGVGGGVLVVPYLTYCGVNPRKIPAISNLCTFTVALVGTVACILTGYQETKHISYATGYVYWPAVLMVAIPSALVAPIGVKLNYILPTKQMRFVFVVILLVMAIKMLF